MLLLGCSDRKRAVKGKLPALDLYDGVNFRVLRVFLHEHGWPPGLCIKILSAKYGLIDATDLIESYDQRLDEATARQINGKVLKSLIGFGKPSSVFVNLGKDYLPAIEGIDRLFQKQRIVHAEGGIGLKMAQMKRWLNALSSTTATLPGHESARSYLYFFPDWDDYVSEPFVHETADEDPALRTTKQYAHEVFGAKDTPYDGMLVSLAQINTGKGTLSRLDAETADRTDLRKAMKIPKRLLLFGDCGAFSYAFEDKPPFSAEEAARLYHRFGFDVGASVDHIPLAEIVVENEKGELVRTVLSEAERRRRTQLTARNAEAFLAACRRHQVQVHSHRRDSRVGHEVLRPLRPQVHRHGLPAHRAWRVGPQIGFGDFGNLLCRSRCDPDSNPHREEERLAAFVRHPASEDSVKLSTLGSVQLRQCFLLAEGMAAIRPELPRW